MMDFKKLQMAVFKQFTKMAKGELFRTNVTGDYLWEQYLEAFPEGTNPIYKERREYDCNCCKQFFRAAGNAVAIVDNKLVSIWDVKLPDEPNFQIVVDTLSTIVKKAYITGVFARTEPMCGAEKTRQLLDVGSKTWNHFYFKLPNKFVKGKNDIGEYTSSIASSIDVFQRALHELTVDSFETVLELIAQNSLYRGEEHKKALSGFLKIMKDYGKLTTLGEKNCFVWSEGVRIGGLAKLRNTSIGTLLVDLSKGEELDTAVGKFEAMVAPSNYKRPTALVTKTMIRKAEQELQELGLVSALGRRHAVIEDITINNVLWADRSSKKAMSVFDELEAEVKVNPKSFTKVEEVTIKDFMKNILPNAKTVELQVENKHESNFMSLLSPVEKDANRLFKWGNDFSWAYNGEVADSLMRQHVKMAGGNINGVLRFSIMWNADKDNHNKDDFDAHCVQPNSRRIYFGNSSDRSTTGSLDVDIRHPKEGVPAVENITWTNKDKMQEGKYEFLVHNFAHRNGSTGFTAEIEYGGVIHKFAYDKSLRNGEYVSVATIKFSKADGIIFVKSLPSTEATRNVWGVNTGRFQKVNVVMHSPNHWDGEEVGNRHYFFIMENCKNPDPVRGFFNEFLKQDLNVHRKVFEILGSKMKAEFSEDQLSGIGFSSTQRNSVLCRVTGQTSRVIKLVF